MSFFPRVFLAALDIAVPVLEETASSRSASVAQDAAELSGVSQQALGLATQGGMVWTQTLLVLAVLAIMVVSVVLIQRAQKHR